MKTKDSISKKKQKLAQEIGFWETRERQIRTDLALTPGAQADRAGAVYFCRQEIAERRAALAKLKSGTKAQRLSGWR